MHETLISWIYSVSSAAEFRKQMIEEFDYTTMMICYDVSLTLTAENFIVTDIYGSPNIPNIHNSKDIFSLEIVDRI